LTAAPKYKWNKINKNNDDGMILPALVASAGLENVDQ
jgi:hypothetical protein